MIAATLTLLVGHVGVSDVAAFFPLNPGDEYTFHEAGGGLRDDFVDKVGEPVELKGGSMAFPVVTTTNGQGPETTFYRIEEEKVLVVAFDPKAPLEHPYSIIQLKAKGEKWNYLGDTQMMGAKAALKMEGKSRLIGQREVLGNKVDVLEVVLDATVVDEEASAHMSQPLGFKTHQVALYARGIGLYELKEEAQLGKQKSTRIRTLTKYVKAAGSGG